MVQALAFPVERAAPRIVFGRALVLRLAEKASALTRVPITDLLGDCRQKQVAWTRFAVMAVAREQGKTYGQIARVLGGLDHTSVLHGVRRAVQLAAEDPDFARLLALLRIEAEQ